MRKGYESHGASATENALLGSAPNLVWKEDRAEDDSLWRGGQMVKLWVVDSYLSSSLLQSTWLLPLG